ncbi:Flp family type IVb pilin [Bacillaceae bacterium S4-13-58]
MEMLKRLFVEEEGQGMTEYGIVLGVIAVAVVGILVALRGQIVTLFQNAQDAISTAVSGDSTTTTP